MRPPRSRRRWARATSSGCCSRSRPSSGGPGTGRPPAPAPSTWIYCSMAKIRSASRACGFRTRGCSSAPSCSSRWKSSAGERRPEATLDPMSHLDELDEYEAELELQLRKEYSAVFGLFRYCVLTQDATYLCNRLDLQYVPQPSYPFFHLRMEDVWVWDKNRPTRMIPRAEVYTSSDVTVEELRGEGDEPSLTAEDLAERIGEPLSPSDDD